MTAAPELEQALDEILNLAESHECENPCHVCLDVLARTVALMCKMEARLNHLSRIVANGN
jgi:hypothetical protein